MLHQFSGGVWFEDALGTLRCFRGVPESRIADLEAALQLFRGQLSTAATRLPSASFAELWRSTPILSASGSLALQLCSLSTDWLTIDQIAEFLLGTETARSLIETVCFPVSKSQVDAAVSQVSYERRQAALISSLVTVGLASDFDSAWAILERCTPTEIEALITARVEAIDPKANVKRQLQELGEEIAARVKETGVDPTMPGGWSLGDLPLA